MYASVVKNSNAKIEAKIDTKSDNKSEAKIDNTDDIDDYEEDTESDVSYESNEELYEDASVEAKRMLINTIVSQCVYKRAKGIQALNDLDGDLVYMSPNSFSKLSYFQELPESFKVNGWTFYTQKMLSYLGDISRELQNHCKRGWFSLYVKENYDGKLCCNVTAKKNRM